MVIFEKNCLVLLSSIILVSCGFLFNRKKINNETIKNVDINRYTGKWYEIARFPHPFEKGLVGVTATYNLKSDNSIEVINSGYKETFNGKFKTSVAKAIIPNYNEKGKIKVSFVWFFSADYNIMELDTIHYQWSMVGSSSPNYFWILSRTPQMDTTIYNMLLKNAAKRGYDTTKIELVLQK